jgi:hypothetical protein
MTTTTTTTITTKVLYEKWSNIASGQMVKHYKRSNGQTLHQVKRSNITSAQTLGWSTLVLTKRLAVHIDWRMPLVSWVHAILTLSFKFLV